jgi:hypothetical protein
MQLVVGLAMLWLVVVAWLIVVMRPTTLRLSSAGLELSGGRLRLSLEPAFLAAVVGLNTVTVLGLIALGVNLPLWPMIVGGSLSVLAAVLLHEMAHLQVAGLLITAGGRPGTRQPMAELLFRLNGGRCRVPTTATVAGDLAVALAGPVANLALASLSGLLRPWLGDELAQAAQLVEQFNLALGLAALLPVTGSDGARIAAASLALWRQARRSAPST